MSITVQFIGSKETDYTDVIHFFKESGCHVVLSTSGKKALQQVKKEKPDLKKLRKKLPTYCQRQRLKSSNWRIQAEKPLSRQDAI